MSTDRLQTAAWHVLIAEDEPDSVRMVSKILEHHGVRVDVAHNGDECLALLEHTTPTLVIVDLAMPGRDGWQTLAAIRANPATAHLPVVAVTAYYAPDVAEDAARAGFDGFFSKPISARAFVPCLEDILRGR
jgi:CheY-like chemotaxis protein